MIPSVCARAYMLCHENKMALCHYPCPEEIDVFTGPHMRMKQLVYDAFEKVRSKASKQGT